MLKKEIHNLKKTFLILLSLGLCLIFLTNCGGPKRSWQNKKDFADKRTTLYNSYIVNGGLRKRDIDSMSPEEKKAYDRARHDIFGNLDQ